MKSIRYWLLSGLTVGLIAGCGTGSPPIAARPQPAPVANGEPTTNVGTAPTLAGVGKAQEKMPNPEPPATKAPEENSSPSTEQQPSKPVKRPDLSQLFQVPEISQEFLQPKESSNLSPEKTDRPRIRLLGFVDVDGFKALVELKGEVFAVTKGDRVEGIEIVDVSPPSVTFQIASMRWGTKLFDQPWYNEQAEPSHEAEERRSTADAPKSDEQVAPLARSAVAPISQATPYPPANPPGTGTPAAVPALPPIPGLPVPSSPSVRIIPSTIPGISAPVLSEPNPND